MRRANALRMGVAVLGSLVLFSEVSAAVVATGQQVRAFLGGASGKLVYTKLDCNDQSCNKQGRSLWYVDLSEATLTERQILSTASDDGEPRNTVVSPDGQWISFNVYNIDNSWAGTWLYVARLQASASKTSLSQGAIPHWWKKPGTNELYLIYNDADLEGSNGWMMSFPWNRVPTKMIQVNPSTGATIGSATTLLNTLANGGRSANGEWLFAAGGAPGTFKVNATVTSNATALETVSLSLDAGTGDWDTLDGCNPSMSPHAAEADIRVMYVCRDNDNNHRAVWTCGVRGDDRKRIMWNDTENPYVDEPEWSNVPQYAAAKASEENITAPFDIYLFKVDGSGLLKVLEGNYSFPYLWVDPTTIGVRGSRATVEGAGVAGVRVNGSMLSVPSGWVRISDMQGRTVAQWQTQTAQAAAVPQLGVGAYVITSTALDGAVTRTSYVVR